MKLYSVMLTTKKKEVFTLDQLISVYIEAVDDAGMLKLAKVACKICARHQLTKKPKIRAKYYVHKTELIGDTIDGYTSGLPTFLTMLSADAYKKR